MYRIEVERGNRRNDFMIAVPTQRDAEDLFRRIVSRSSPRTFVRLYEVVDGRNARTILAERA